MQKIVTFNVVEYPCSIYYSGYQSLSLHYPTETPGSPHHSNENIIFLIILLLDSKYMEHPPYAPVLITCYHRISNIFQSLH